MEPSLNVCIIRKFKKEILWPLSVLLYMIYCELDVTINRVKMLAETFRICFKHRLESSTNLCHQQWTTGEVEKLHSSPSVTNLTGMEVKSDIASDRRIRVPHHLRMVHWLLPCKILSTFVKSLHLVCRCTKCSCLLAFQHWIPIFGYNTHSGIRSRIRLNSTPMSSL